MIGFGRILVAKRLHHIDFIVKGALEKGIIYIRHKSQPHMRATNSQFDLWWEESVPCLKLPEDASNISSVDLPRAKRDSICFNVGSFERIYCCGLNFVKKVRRFVKHEEFEVFRNNIL